MQRYRPPQAPLFFARSRALNPIPRSEHLETSASCPLATLTE